VSVVLPSIAASPLFAAGLRPTSVRVGEAAAPTQPVSPITTAAGESGEAGVAAVTNRPLTGSTQTSSAEEGSTQNGAAGGDAAQPGEPDDSQAAAEQELLQRLKARDAEVRAHENAHRAAGAGLVRGGGYTYQAGPDGRRYAIGGDVQIDVSTVPGDPQATAIKMEQVIRAALAPAEPSTQDRQVAAQAAQLRAEALMSAQADRLDRSQRPNRPGAEPEERERASARPQAVGEYERVSAMSPEGRAAVQRLAVWA